MTDLELLAAYDAERKAIPDKLRARDGGPHNNALRAKLADGTTMKVQCEVISAWIVAVGGREIDPKAIFEYSPSGELFHVFIWLGAACKWLAENDLPEETARRIISGRSRG